MFELRLNNDFSLIGIFKTKDDAINTMNSKIDDVLIDDSILMFDGVKLVFSRNGKKTINKVVKMKKHILISRLDFFKTLVLIGSDNFEIINYGNLWVNGLINLKSLKILENNKIYFDYL